MEKGKVSKKFGSDALGMEENLPNGTEENGMKSANWDRGIIGKKLYA